MVAPSPVVVALVLPPKLPPVGLVAPPSSCSVPVMELQPSPSPSAPPDQDLVLPGQRRVETSGPPHCQVDPV
jgi:hypothetical protein